MAEQLNPVPVGNAIKWLSRAIIIAYAIIQLVEYTWNSFAEIINP